MADRAADPADDPQMLLAQRDIVQRELQRMERRMAAIEEALLETQRALGTVRGLHEAANEAGRPGSHDVLVPAGAGVHVAARIDVNAKILLPVGAGYLVEGKPEDIASALEERLKAIQANFEGASEQAEQLAQTAAAIEERLGGFQGE